MELEIKIRTESGWRNPTFKDIHNNGILEMIAHLDCLECVVKVSSEYGEAFFTSSIGGWYDKFKKEGRTVFRISDVHKAFGISKIHKVLSDIDDAQLVRVVSK